MSDKTEPLLKVLTGAGIGSRRRLTDAIKQGRVVINGEVAENFRHPVNRETDHITVDGKEIELKAKDTIVLMLNKPPDVITTASDERKRQTVLDIIAPKYRNLRLYPVGRLDKGTSGLLLLTNDGNLTYRLTHPRFEHEKEYLLQIAGMLSPSDKDRLKRGIKIEDGWTHPAHVRDVKSPPPFNYSITIHEGRKRQVHRMLAALGHSVLALKRVRMGNLTLGNLKEGEVRELGSREIQKLLSGKQ